MVVAPELEWQLWRAVTNGSGSLPRVPDSFNVLSLEIQGHFVGDRFSPAMKDGGCDIIARCREITTEPGGHCLGVLTLKNPSAPTGGIWYFVPNTGSGQ
ncbi:MAG: hypothetical protein RB292_02845 [Patescibacteria group bacterium]|jgi:hypothetical protein|nr:hypothetical protein [Patescibacteria group bacterium]